MFQVAGQVAALVATIGNTWQDVGFYNSMQLCMVSLAAILFIIALRSVFVEGRDIGTEEDVELAALVNTQRNLALP